MSRRQTSDRDHGGSGSIRRKRSLPRFRHRRRKGLAGRLTGEAHLSGDPRNPRGMTPGEKLQDIFLEARCCCRRATPRHPTTAGCDRPADEDKPRKGRLLDIEASGDVFLSLLLDMDGAVPLGDPDLAWRTWRTQRLDPHLYRVRYRARAGRSRQIILEDRGDGPENPSDNGVSGGSP